MCGAWEEACPPRWALMCCVWCRYPEPIWHVWLLFDPDLDTTALGQDKTRRISTLDLSPSGE